MKKMQMRAGSMILTAAMLLSMLPGTAMAADTQAEQSQSVYSESAQTDFAVPMAAEAVYVSATGDDTAAGTQAAPVATLAKAVELAKDGATIFVAGNLTVTKCARFYNKNLTITSADPENVCTITRGDGFATQSDTARSWYNPAMIEVQGTAGTAGLTLTNIILDDAGKHEGTVFAQASSEEGHGDNTVYAQDAMIASNAVVPCTITLGEGAVLRNFGGMSAVRVTDKAQVVMQSGSVIEDTTVTDRTKGKAAGEVGPAGAIWSQGSEVTMEEGSMIQNVIGRAIYMDSGKVTMGGTLKGIQSDTDMWQGVSGTAIHLRGTASGVMSGTATGFKGGTMVSLDGCTFTLTETGKMIDSQGTSGIGMSDVNELGYNTLTVNGEIGRMKGTVSPIQGNSANITIGKTGNIHDNEVNYGALYMQADLKIDIYGKINNNYGSKYGAAMATPGHGYVQAVMYDGAEMCGNVANKGGGALQLKYCTFTMNGGKISGNITKAANGGAAYLRDESEFIMNGGEISGNYAPGFGGGIAYFASGTNVVPVLQLNGGTVSDNYMNAVVTTEADGTVTAQSEETNDVAVAASGSGKLDRYVSISDDMVLGDENIYMAQYKFKLVNPAMNVKFGNASSASVEALKAASNKLGWGDPLAALWFQSEEPVVALSMDEIQNIDTAMPVYVLAMPADADGDPVGTDAKLYNTQDLSVVLSAGNENGYVLAVVQPSTDHGGLDVSYGESGMGGTAFIKENKKAENYPVDYTIKYTPSESMKSIITAAGGKATYTLAVSPDSRLTGTPDLSTFDGTSIVVHYQLPAANFEANQELLTTAVLTITTGGKDYVLPSNQVVTKMIPLAEFTITATAGTNGTISPAGTATVYEGDSKTYTITPDAGSRIKDVKVDGVSVGTVVSYTFDNIDASHTIKAEFVQEFTITATAGANGTIAPNGAQKYDKNTNATYTITPNPGSRIKDVKVDGVSVGAVKSYTFKNITANHTIEAEFVQEFTITATAGDDGTLTPSGAKKYDINTDATYTVKADKGYRIKDVKVDGKSVGAVDSYTFENIVANHTIEAEFIQEFTIKATSGANGTIAPSGAKKYDIGTNATYSMTPDKGYRVSDVLVDGVSVGVVYSYTFQNIAADHTIRVVFEKRNDGGNTPLTYVITAQAGNGGSISPQGDVNVTRNTNQTFLITPSAGYEIADVVVDGKSVGAVNEYTFEKVLEDHTIEVSFRYVGMVPGDTGVSQWLDTENHFAYLSGFEDGSFRPASSMTRAQAAQMFYNLLLNKNIPTASVFVDVPAGEWYAKAVNTLYALGMIKGVDAQHFEPSRTITRAEFTSMALNFSNQKTGGVNIFSDVSENDWFYSIVLGAVKNGWIGGYEDGTFRPNQTITRAEAAVIVNKMLGRSADVEYVDDHAAQLRVFTDVDKSNWAYYGIAEAANTHEYDRVNGAENWR